LEAVTVPAFEEAVEEVTISVLESCRQPAAALQFARFLQAPGKGQKNFAAHGYQTVDGDAWADVPTLTLYSGGLNRIAIEQTLPQFEAREGARINVVYNGCGVLVGMMKVGGTPDAYLACDTSYLEQVRDKFLPARELSETDMIVIVQKGNPKNIHSLADLAQPGLKLAVANEEQSALGGLTRHILEQLGLYDSVARNVKVNAPTADYLVNQMALGTLDAAIVYRANVSRVHGKFDVIPITEREPRAVQPIAVAKDSHYKYLTNRLIDALASDESRERFEAADFRFRVGQK
jgi:ABC-type molybdate transport system substrate-binding protein